MEIRRAAPSDAAVIAAVECASWRAAYAELMPAEYLAALSPEARVATWSADIEKHGERGRKRVLLAVDGGRVAGYSLHGIPGSARPGEGLLYFFYFAPQAWGGGFAEPLMAAVMNDFRDLGVERAQLWVLTLNERARRFYERLGWRPDGERSIEDYGGTTLEAMRYSIGVDR